MLVFFKLFDMGMTASIWQYKFDNGVRVLRSFFKWNKSSNVLIEMERGV